MSVSFCLFSGLSKVSMVPAGSLAKASSVGAKTVNGPAPLRVSTNPAACTAATKVLKRPSATAVSTISIGFGVGSVVAVEAGISVGFGAIVGAGVAAGAQATRAKTAMSSTDKIVVTRFMFLSRSGIVY